MNIHVTANEAGRSNCLVDRFNTYIDLIEEHFDEIPKERFKRVMRGFIEIAEATLQFRPTQNLQRR